ncbi:MAG: L,D-transpeptidase family protein [Bacillota bacterium]
MRFFWCFLAVFFWGAAAVRADILLVKKAGQGRIKCEDGMEFLLNGKEAGAKSILPNKDLIVIDVRRARLVLFRDGRIFKSYAVAVGKPETPTPVGEWRIMHKGGNWGGGFGERWMGLNVPWGIFGIHGTNKPSSIGSMASHGCIRMFNRSVIELYRLVQVGTPVYIMGDLPRVSPRRVMQRPQAGRDILLLQYALRAAGFDPGMANARFGPATEAALLKFQIYYGLPPTGKAQFNEQYLLGMR